MTRDTSFRFENATSYSGCQRGGKTVRRLVDFASRLMRLSKKSAGFPGVFAFHDRSFSSIENSVRQGALYESLASAKSVHLLAPVINASIRVDSPSSMSHVNRPSSCDPRPHRARSWVRCRQAEDILEFADGDVGDGVATGATLRHTHNPGEPADQPHRLRSARPPPTLSPRPEPGPKG